MLELEITIWISARLLCFQVLSDTSSYNKKKQKKKRENTWKKRHKNKKKQKEAEKGEEEEEDKEEEEEEGNEKDNEEGYLNHVLEFCHSQASTFLAIRGIYCWQPLHRHSHMSQRRHYTRQR